MVPAMRKHVRLGGATLWAVVIIMTSAVNVALAQRSATTQIATLTCPLIPAELAKAAAKAVDGKGRCGLGCTGCGCLGGPGYRGSDGQCVSFKSIIRICGPPPHAACKRECRTPILECRDRGPDLLKALAATTRPDPLLYRRRTRGSCTSPLANRRNRTGTDAQCRSGTGPYRAQVCPPRNRRWRWRPCAPIDRPKILTRVTLAGHADRRYRTLDRPLSRPDYRPTVDTRHRAGVPCAARFGSLAHRVVRQAVHHPR